jgi:hypothetical protein
LKPIINLVSDAIDADQTGIAVELDALFMNLLPAARAGQFLFPAGLDRST